VKERPILFSGPMVRAILEGRKTMTRRVIKEFPLSGYRWGGWIVESSNRKETGMATVVPEENSKYCCTGKIGAHCPYGQPGDRLWVRETWKCDSFMDGSNFGIRYIADNEFHSCSSDLTKWLPLWEKHADKLRPSIFMPRWASRITLELSAVRVERLQDISEEDAKAEGCIAWRGVPGDGERTARQAFITIWDSINAERGYSWESNPWIWVIEFKRIEATA